MQQLTLLGLNSDGQSLVLVDDHGERYTLPIDDQLRSYIRKDRLALESILTQAGQDLRPRDIQALLRAGATAQEVATSSGLDLEHVTKYQSPVLAERRWAVKQALATTLSHHFDAPTFGDLVIDRLATRSVDTRLLKWDATRSPADPWVIHLTFIQNARQLDASWELDVATGTLTALDEQARWLTETSAIAQPALAITPIDQGEHLENPGMRTPNSGLNTGKDGAREESIASSGTAQQSQENSHQQQTEALLAELNQARGTRLQVAALGEQDDVAAMEAAVRGFENSEENLAVSQHKQPQQNKHSEAQNKHSEAQNSQENTFAHSFEQNGDNRQSHTQAQVLSLQRIRQNQHKTGHDGKNATKEQSSSTTKIGTETVNTETSPTGTLPGLESFAPSTGDLPEFQGHTSVPSVKNAKRKSRRRSVPSWDEILFGAKPE